MQRRLGRTGVPPIGKTTTDSYHFPENYGNQESIASPNLIVIFQRKLHETSQADIAPITSAYHTIDPPL